MKKYLFDHGGSDIYRFPIENASNALDISDSLLRLHRKARDQ
jgi:hypothetical protein